MPDTYTRLAYHLVFTTKGRQPSLTEDLRADLYSFIGGIVRRKGGVLIEIGGVEDHVHVLLGAGPTRTVAEWVRLIKGRSSKWVNDLGGRSRFAWQVGYGAFSVSGSQIPVVRRYLRRQEEHHRRRSYEVELKALCRGAGWRCPGGS